MIIQRVRQLAKIIQRIRPFANDHPEDLGSCKWSSGGTGRLQMITRHPRHPNHLSQDPDLISQTFLEQFVLVYLIWGLVWNPAFIIFLSHVPLSYLLSLDQNISQPYHQETGQTRWWETSLCSSNWFSWSMLRPNHPVRNGSLDGEGNLSRWTDVIDSTDNRDDQKRTGQMEGT